MEDTSAVEYFIAFLTSLNLCIAAHNIGHNGIMTAYFAGSTKRGYCVITK